MKSNYINGKIIEVSEKGSWTEAKVKNKENLQDVILIEKNITIESTDGKIHNIYCNKNINIKNGDYVYFRLNKNIVEEMYKNENAYKIAINRDKEKKNNKILKNKEENHFIFMNIFLPIILTPIFQPILKTIIQTIMYIGTPTENDNLGSISNHFTSVLGPDSFIFNVILYLITFNTLFAIVKIILDSSNNSSDRQKSNVIKSIECEENIKVKESNENISYKVSLTKK